MMGIRRIAGAAHRTPVLPAGWAPLSLDQQEAVQRACDAAQECLIFKLGSLWEPGCEYRVYRLTTEQWAGLSVVCKYAPAASGHQVGPCNFQLLGLAWDAVAARAAGVKAGRGGTQALDRAVSAGGRLREAAKRKLSRG